MCLGPIRTDMNHGGSFPLEGFDHHARYMYIFFSFTAASEFNLFLLFFYVARSRRFLGGGGEMFEKKTRSRGVG